MVYAESDYLMLSGIQHFQFCKRQWSLIHIEQQWAENEATAHGQILHQKTELLFHPYGIQPHPISHRDQALLMRHA